jgi:hypothetical protein
MPMRLPTVLPVRGLSARLLLLSWLALGASSSACSDNVNDLPTAPNDGRSDAGGGNEPPVTMVSGPDDRNNADPGVVTKPKSDDKPMSFESDLTGQASSAGSRNAGGGGSLGGFAAGDSSATAGAAPPANAGTPVGTLGGGQEAERAIVEADIVQVAGNLLYALSQYGGLSVIDIADPTKLRLVGRYRELTGTPFEMYLRDSVAIVMFTSWGQYKKQTDGSYQWIQTSKVVALDTANPAAIAPIGSFDIPGEVSDSRVVGDVMYVVGYQNGSCWDCKANSPLTSVLSLNIANPRAIARVDALEFASSNEGYGGGKRSIAVNTQRIYVAGPEYGQQQPTGSTVQVVDISNAGGDLVEGTTVKVAGQITNRWQLDEFEGVLRVISQPFPWWRNTNQAATVVQTFTVTSSQQISALGRTNLVVPPNETLRSVRFDGPRGYAITAEQIDPLFTIDLSNPAQPRQAGELEMPGFVYHMEPRGNRLIGLGYDQNNPAGGITVSIFDVSNIAAPRMLSRVNFGGTWASLPEDQDRIHKAFKILDQQGLITVPFSGWSDTRRGDIYCSGQYKSGIQLIDFQGDTLTARGVAPSRGQARRAIVNGNGLLSVSDEAVDAFDISNRASPVAQGRLTVAQNVAHALPLANGHVARIVQDWYGGQRSVIDVVPLADVDRPEGAVGELDLSKVLASPSDTCAGNAYIEQAFVSGNEIDLLTSRYIYATNNYTQVSALVVIDATDPKAPKLVSKLEWQEQQNTGSIAPQNSPWYGFSSYYNYGFIGQQTNTLRVEKAIVKLEQRFLYNGSGLNNFELRLNVLDLSDPTKPTKAVLALPKAAGYAGLVADGKDVLFSHYDEVVSGSRARFYIDRVDLTDPTKPALTDKISVPGTLLHYDRANGRAVTSELTRHNIENLTNQECWQRFGFAEWRQNGTQDAGYVPYQENAKGMCTGYMQHLHMVRFVTGGAVLDSSYHLAESERVSSSSLGDARVTAVLNHGYIYWGWGPACFNCGRGGLYGGGGTATPAEVLVLGGLATGTFDVGHLTVDDDGQNAWWGFYGSPPVYASGTRALVRSASDVAIVDTSVPSAPTIVSKVPLYGYANDLQAVGKLVLLSLGMNGVQRIDL